ncbi:MAG: pantetheine-phosphate adenylyltransferase [Solirubrobacterales bacterium]
MTTAIYAGSFDPFTIGHLSILEEAIILFDRVVIAIAINSEKKRRIEAELMLKAIRQTVTELYGNDKIKVIIFKGLIADLAEREGTTHLIRGIRNGMDYEYEENLAKINETLGLTTIYLRAGSLSYVSSSMVMDLYKYGRDIVPYVPTPVYEAICLNTIKEED